MSSQPEAPAKRKYEPPKFVEYGDIREITRANDNAGAADNGSNPGMDKT